MHSGVQIDGTAEVTVETVEDPKVVGGVTYYNVLFTEGDTMSHRIQVNYDTLWNLIHALK